MIKRLFASALAFGLALSAMAQVAMPPVNATPFRDTSLLKPPPSAKVAIIEFEDLECPLCARDASLVRGAAAKYNIPLVHHDFIIESHAWSRAAAIDARYLEDKVSLKTAEAFRLDVFAHQQSISSKDDLDQFTRRWFQAHGQAMPFLIDPTQRCALEVQADCTLGARLGIRHTPTIIVVTAEGWIEVTDAAQLYTAIDLAESQVKTSPARQRSAARP